MPDKETRIQKAFPERGAEIDIERERQIGGTV